MSGDFAILKLGQSLGQADRTEVVLSGLFCCLCALECCLFGRVIVKRESFKAFFGKELMYIGDHIMSSLCRSAEFHGGLKHG
jgi:hypothetical protein